MLRTWFWWRTNNTVRKKAPTISFSTSKGRTLQETQVYSKMFYESKLKAIIDDELKGKSVTKPERLSKTVEVTKREWENESEDVKDEVRKRREELKREQSSEEALSQAAIDNLGHVVSTFLQHLKKTTGWTGFFVIGI
jgi:hypothetical protein